MEHFKIETGRMKGAPECMRISGFMHGVNNPELTKRLNEHIPKTVEEMMTSTTTFIRGETAAAQKKFTSPWKWGYYMAARTVKALGNYRRRRALYKRMDELYDSKVAVSLQWYNRKTQNKGNPSGAVYRSRDAYVPSHKRDSYYP
ncbi:hypothetical protein Tco_0378534 [Tanacetum coccineum]